MMVSGLTLGLHHEYSFNTTLAFHKVITNLQTAALMEFPNEKIIVYQLR